MYNNTKTIYGIDLMQTMLLNREYRPLPNTTLNDKFNVLVDNPLPVGKYPTLNYLAIGNGGIGAIDEDNDVLKVSTHTADHASLFNHIPFILTPKSSDLSLGERSRYRMRVERVIGGEEYVAYYLRVISNIDSGNIMKMRYNEDIHNKPILSVFNTNNLAILNPSPLLEDTYVGDTDSYLIKVTGIHNILTRDELINIKRALEILGEDNLTISEIGLCSGYDVEHNGGLETICTQIMYHVSVGYDVETYIHSGEAINITTDIGGVEPVISGV